MATSHARPVVGVQTAPLLAYEIINVVKDKVVRSDPNAAMYILGFYETDSVDIMWRMPVTWAQAEYIATEVQRTPQLAGYYFKGEFYWPDQGDADRNRRFEKLMRRIEQGTSELEKKLTAKPETVKEMVEVRVVDWQTTFNMCVRVALAAYILAAISMAFF